MSTRGYSVEVMKYGLRSLIAAAKKFAENEEEGLKEFHENKVWIDLETARRMLNMPGAPWGTARADIIDKRIRSSYRIMIINLLKEYCGTVILIGGNDHTRQAGLLAVKTKKMEVDLAVLAFPKTIDYDTVVYPVGAKSAGDLANEAVEHAVAHLKKGECLIMASMGRDNGALTVATAGELSKKDPRVIVAIPEYSSKQGVTFEMLVQAVQARIDKYGSAVLILSEGFRISEDDPLLKMVIDAKPFLKYKYKTLKGKTDKHGNPALNELGIWDFVAKALEIMLGFKRDKNLFVNDLGYSYRGGVPNEFDKAVATKTAEVASEMLINHRDEVIRRGGVLIAADRKARTVRDIERTMMALDFKEGMSLGTTDLLTSGIYTDAELDKFPILGRRIKPGEMLPEFTPPEVPTKAAADIDILYALRLVLGQAESALDMDRPNIAVIAHNKADRFISFLVRAVGNFDGIRHELPAADRYILERTAAATLAYTSEDNFSLETIVAQAEKAFKETGMLNLVISGDYKLKKDDKLLNELCQKNAGLNDVVGKIISRGDDGKGFVRFGTRIADIIYIALSERKLPGIRKNIMTTVVNLLPGKSRGPDTIAGTASKDTPSMVAATPWELFPSTVPLKKGYGEITGVELTVNLDMQGAVTNRRIEFVRPSEEAVKTGKNIATTIVIFEEDASGRKIRELARHNVAEGEIVRVGLDEKNNLVIRPTSDKTIATCLVVGADDKRKQVMAASTAANIRRQGVKAGVFIRSVSAPEGPAIAGTMSKSANPEGSSQLPEERRSGNIPSMVAAKLIDTVQANVKAASLALGKDELSVSQALAECINTTMLLNDFAESVGIKADTALENMEKAGLAIITDKSKKGYKLTADFFSDRKLSEFMALQIQSAGDEKVQKLIDLSAIRIERIILNSVNVNNFLDKLTPKGSNARATAMALGEKNAFATLVTTWELENFEDQRGVGQLALDEQVNPATTKFYADSGVSTEFSVPFTGVSLSRFEALERYEAVMALDMARGGYNYRGMGTKTTVERFFNESFLPEWYGKIRDFVKANFDDQNPLKAIVTNGIGANDQFMWSLVNMYNANRPEGAPAWYHITTARDLALIDADLKRAGYSGRNALFIDISRSGGTWEGVEVGIRSLALGYNRRIALANGGAVKAIALAAAKIGGYEPLVIGMSPDIGGRNMHRKTTIYYTAQTVAGMFLPAMDSTVFAALNDTFDKANDFAKPETNLAVSVGNFLFGAMRLLGTEHIAVITNTEPLRLVATEWEQYIMEGCNKEDIISMGIHDLVGESHYVLQALATSSAGKKTTGMAILDEAAPYYNMDLARVNALKDKMPLVIFTIDSREAERASGLKGGISPAQQAAFDILWTDLVTVFTTLLRVDANSNPNVKLVREYTAKRVAAWKDAQQSYERDAIGRNEANLLVSYGSPSSPGIGSDGEQMSLTKADAATTGRWIARKLAKGGMLKGRDRLNLFVGRDDLTGLVRGLIEATYRTELVTRFGWIPQTALFPLWSHKGLEANLACSTNPGKPLLANKTVNIFFNARRLGTNPFFTQPFDNLGIMDDKYAGINGATIHQTNDAMTMPNIKRMAEVSPTILLEFNDIDSGGDIRATIAEFYEGFTDELAKELKTQEGADAPSMVAAVELPTLEAVLGDTAKITGQIRDYRDKVLLPQNKFDLTDTVIVMKKLNDPKNIIAGRGPSEILKGQMSQQYNRLRKDLRDVFTEDGVVEVASSDDIIPTANKLIADGRKVIMLDIDGSFSEKFASEDEIAVLLVGGETHKAESGKNYCVVAADGKAMREICEETAKLAKNEEPAPFININAMAMVGVGILNKDKDNGMLFSLAYEAFTGEAPKDLVKKLMDNALWFLKTLPKIFRIDINEAADQRRLSKLPEVSA
jgi:6-phosphofructokinase